MNKTFLKITKQVTGGGLRAVLPLCLCALFSVLLTSCPNSADDSYSPPAQPQQTAPTAPTTTVPAGGTEAAPEVQYITFRGSVQTTGALPASYARAVDDLFLQEAAAVEGAQIDVARSARPDATVDGELLKFFATATAREDGTVVEGNFDVEGADDPSVFEMDLAVGKTWDIVCGVRKTEGGQIVFQDTYSKQVTAQDSVLKHDFELIPVQEGSGSVSLTVNFSAPADKVEARWEKNYAGVPALTLSPDVGKPSPVTISAGDAASASGVPNGSYNIVLSFKDGNGIAVYETVQSVTVLNGLVTNTWTLEGGEGAITEDSDHVVSFNVGDTLVKDTTSNWIYVGVPKDLVGQEGVSASDENKGGAYSPLETLGAAFKKIQSAGKGDKDFQIYVSGEVVGSSTLGSEIAAGVNAKSITIQGLEGNASDSLKGSGGRVLLVESNVPVTFKNIKITGGDSVEKGGGLFIKADGASVTLENGTLISENKAQTQGGAVYISGSSTYAKKTELVIKDGAKISGNSLTGNAGSMGGMAIWADSSSKVTMKGGEISGHNSDSEAHDGAVLLYGSAVFDLDGGKVTENTAKVGGANFFIYDATLNIKGGEISKGTAGGSNVSEAQGAGVYVGGSGSVNMSGGKITGNKLIAKSSGDAMGAGICAKSPAQVNLTGGAIEGNYVDKTEANCKAKGGAVYVEAKYESDYKFATLSIGGSANIPCDGEGMNDVYLARANANPVDDPTGGKYSMVQVSSLTPPAGVSKVAVITAQDWQRGLDILKSPSGSEAKDYNKYFDTTAEDFGFKQRSGDANKNIAMLKADLYVSPRGTDQNTNDGTKSKPYRSIQYAILKLSSAGEPETIFVDCKKDDGTFAPVYVGHSEEPRTQNLINSDLSASSCSELTICGVNYDEANGVPKDFLDNQTGLTGSYLSTVYISSSIPVTFKKLLIKGGSVGTEIGLYHCGAGLCIVKEGSTAPVVKLAEGAMIAGNRLSDTGWTKGGGVYVGPEASLFMYSNAWIGDKKQALVTETAPTSFAGASNCANLGGGIYNDGNVYLGYTGKNGTTLVPAPVTGENAFTGGVSNNYSGTEGGGIYNNGTLEIADGEICYNGSFNYVSDSATGVGGGVQHAGGSLKISGGQIYANAATKGGGLHVAASSAELTDNGVIGHDALAKGNAAKNGGSEAFGGGVYIAAGKTFEMKGGTVKGNDATTYGGGVYIAAGGGVDIDGAFKMSGGTLSGNKAGDGTGSGCGVYDAGSFNISGSAYIPKGAGTAASPLNDVFLSSESYLVNISGDLSPTDGVTVGALATPGLKRGTKVLSGTEARILAYSSYFKPTVEGFGIFTNDPVKTQGVIDTEFIYVSSAANSDSDKRWGTQTQPYKYISEAVNQCWNINKDFKIKVSGEIKNGRPEEIPEGNADAKTGLAKSITIEGLNGIDSTSGEPKDSINRGLDKAHAATTVSTYAGNALIIASASPIVIKNLKITGGAYKGGKGGGICASSAKVYNITLDEGALVCGNYAYYGGGVYVNGKDATNRSTFVMKGTARVGENQANYQGGGVYALKTKFYMSGSAVIGKKLSGTAATSSASSESDSSNRVIVETTGASDKGSGGGLYCSNSAVYLGYASTGSTSDLTGAGIVYNYAGNKSAGGGVYVDGGEVHIASGSVSNNGCLDSADTGMGGGVYLNAGTMEVTGGKMEYNHAKLGGGVYANVAMQMSGGSMSANTVTADTGKGGAVYVASTGGLELKSGAKLYTSSDAERTNDVYLESGKYITVTGDIDSSITTVAKITPSVWRGTKILAAGSSLTDGLTETITNKFDLTQDGWDKFIYKTTTDNDSAKIDSDIYVAGTGAVKCAGYTPKDEGNTGESSGNWAHPFKTIGAALARLDASHTKIVVDGTITGVQSVASGSIPSGVASLEIAGYGSSSTINANGGGTALTIAAGAASFPITVSDLAITGGSVASGYGGGIRLTKGTLALCGNTKIYGNKAMYGGGVYVDSDGKLLMYGAALIGDTIEATATSATLTTTGTTGCSNMAKNGAGIYNKGVTALGYTAYTDETTKTAAPTTGTNAFTGGVRRNYASYSYSGSGSHVYGGGGGIYNEAGTVSVNGGNISYNYSNESGGGIFASGSVYINGGTLLSNTANMDSSYGYGGAVFSEYTQTVTMTGGTVQANTARYGGGVNIRGTFVMSGGTLKENEAKSSGGAVYHNGTDFQVDGTAYIPAGTAAKYNDVQLSTETKYVKILGATKHTELDQMAITPSSYKRGLQVLAGVDVTIIAYYKRFKVLEEDWKLGYYIGETVTKNTASTIGADLWVAGTYGGATLPSGVASKADPSDSNTGTKARPYASITKAANMCANTSFDYVINIAGTIGGSAQQIPARNTSAYTACAKSFTLKGVDSSATIDRGLTGADAEVDGTALTINNVDSLINIESLTIKGGNVVGKGGGIFVIHDKSTSTDLAKKAKVNLKSGVVVTQNKASMEGGGVYVAVRSIVCLSGDAVIGNASGSLPANDSVEPAAANGINKAQDGGGIFSYGTVAIGQVVDGSGNYTDAAYTGSICANLATRNGGGVYISKGSATSSSYTGILKLVQGAKITKNKAVADGGGVYASEGAVFTMSAGTISANAAVNGGGVYTEGMLYMAESAVIGDSSASGYATGSTTCSNYASSNGGGVYVGGDGGIALGANAEEEKELSGGVYFNYASGMGGGIYNGGSDGTTIYTGNVCKNAAVGRGGGICSNLVPFTMANGKIDGNYALNGGGICFLDSDSTYYNQFLSGGTISNNAVGENGDGGGIYIGAKNSLKMSGGTISGNTAIASGGKGGGVYIEGSTANLFMSKNALIGDTGTTRNYNTDGSGYSNKATQGGGIYSNGGGVYIGYKDESNKEAMTSDSYGVRHNSTTGTSGVGGGVYANGGKVKVASGGLSYNFAYKDAGGIYAKTASGNGEISAGTIYGNLAGKKGGAVYLEANYYFNITGGTISNNAAAKDAGASSSDGGGAVFMANNANTTLNISGGTFSSNTVYGTSAVGGAIYFRAGKLNISGGATITTSSTARTNDVYLYSKSTNIAPGQTFTGNGTNTPVAVYLGWTPTAGDAVLSGSYVGSHYAKFKIIYPVGWTINTSGKAQAN